MTNQLYTNDNLDIMYGMNSESVDLIYLDPPFNSNRIYSAPIGSAAAGASFEDMWSWGDVDELRLHGLVGFTGLIAYIESIGNIHGRAMMAYSTYMAQRIIEMHRILKPTGSLYLHCDPTASHYLKPLMDAIFGKGNFRNEIIWHYASMSRTKKDFPRKHDIVFRYCKTATYVFNFESVLIPYKDSTISRSKYGGAGFTGKDGHADYLDKNGKIPDTVWDIPHVKSKKESTGYPTQKPLALLHRIIKASSNDGDIVFDPFCGCATTCVAAQQLGRHWIGIDIEAQAADLLVKRLHSDAGMFRDFVHLTAPPVRTDIVVAEPSSPVKHTLYEEQSGKCLGCEHDYLVKDMEIDHIVPKSRGGGDYIENYQLLCGNCNRTKGNRPMEFLRMQIENRKKLREKYITFGE